MVGNTLKEFNTNIFREYLLTNGLGGYSSTSINGNLSRQYHGLFISSFSPPTDRFIAIHQIEEIFNDQNLGTFKYLDGKNEVIQNGANFLYEFKQDPFPTFKYRVDNDILIKEIIMGNSRDLIGVIYKTENFTNFSTNIYFNFRNVHSINEMLETPVNKVNDTYTINFGDKTMYIYTDGDIDFIGDTPEKENFEGYIVDPILRKNIVYDYDFIERGGKELDISKRLFKISFKNNSIEHYFVASFEKLNSYKDIIDIKEMEYKRLQTLISDVKNSFLKDLIIASDKFLTKKGDIGKTIVAGYPWFNDWGRDTMISFTGILLVPKRFKEAQDILLTYSKYCKDGIIPNSFLDFSTEPIYNSVDSSLWFFYAVHKYIEYTKDYSFIKDNIYSTLESIIKSYIDGTIYNIKVDNNDGLLQAGNIDTQLTWMDVKYKGVAVTPRYGKAVELNSLWYNALHIFKNLTLHFNLKFNYDEYIEKIESSFTKLFYNESGYLNDYITPTEINTQIRPNQIFAISLPYTPLKDKKIKKSIIDILYKKLLTPYGLKSLSDEDKDFKAIYRGNLYSRDFSYHQGSVWSWLIGAFIEGYSKIYKDKDLTFFIEELSNHFYNDSAINNISEIFDGTPPYNPKGCFAQAWSVAELIRVYYEIILKKGVL